MYLVVQPTRVAHAWSARLALVRLLHDAESALKVNAPVILTGILRPGANGDRAWCRVVEFAEEFGISVSYDPLVLTERRGGKCS